MTRVGAIGVVARRELSAYFHAPIAYVVGVLFLAVQGFSFWAVVKVLADPGRPAPYGAVLHNHFGGTFLYWAVLFLVVAVVSMRLVADEKRTGTWEALLTTPLEESEILVGKWLGALGFYVVLWIPTLLHLVVLDHYAPPGASFDPGPAASAYLGVAITGAAFLAIGMVASVATANQIIASVITFVILLAMLLAGQLREITPSWFDDSPNLSAFVDAIDLRAHMDLFARGAIELGVVAFYLGLMAVALAAATWFCAIGRRRRSELQGRGLATGLVGAIVVLCNLYVARHPATWDVSRSDANTLDASTLRVLDGVDEPVKLLVVRGGLAELEPVFVELDRLLARMIRAQPLLVRRDISPALDRKRLETFAVEFAISFKDLESTGAIVVQVGSRRRVIHMLDMAGFDRVDLGVGRMDRFRAEEALTTAIADLTNADRPTVCAISGHGELPLRTSDVVGAPSWAPLVARLDRDGMRVRDVGTVGAGVPAYCRVAILMGPQIPLAADEALAVASYLSSGGRLLVTSGDALQTGIGQASLPDTGLELVLAGYGISLPRAVVIDPAGRVGLPLTWMTTTGYGDHPVSEPFAGRRITVWQVPRAVLAHEPKLESRSASTLVYTSESGWGEKDLGSLHSGASYGPGDIEGEVSIAAAAEDTATGARVIVVGSARSFSTELEALGGNDAFAVSMFAWLTGRAQPVDIGDKIPGNLRLVMTRGQLRKTFAFCVIIIPLLFAFFGTGIWWRRRRG